MDKLATLYQVLCQELGALAAIQYCGLLPARRDSLPLPAIVLDMVELEPARERGTGDLSLISHWEARVLVSDTLDELSHWALVQAVLLALDTYHWPQINIARPVLKQASPDPFSPEYQGHRVWLIEWTQQVVIGDNIWQGQFVVPTVLSVGCPGEPRQLFEVSDV